MKLEEFVGLLGMYRLFCEVLRHSVPVFVKHQRPHGTGFHTLFLCAGQHCRLLPCCRDAESVSDGLPETLLLSPKRLRSSSCKPRFPHKSIRIAGTECSVT